MEPLSITPQQHWSNLSQPTLTDDNQAQWQMPELQLDDDRILVPDTESPCQADELKAPPAEYPD